MIAYDQMSPYNGLVGIVNLNLKGGSDFSRSTRFFYFQSKISSGIFGSWRCVVVGFRFFPEKVSVIEDVHLTPNRPILVKLTKASRNNGWKGTSPAQKPFVEKGMQVELCIEPVEPIVASKREPDVVVENPIFGSDAWKFIAQFVFFNCTIMKYPTISTLTSGHKVFNYCNL